MNTDPLLLPLADNGGPTRTHALRLESPAIDAGSNALAVDADGNTLATDQRGFGFDRIIDGVPPTVDVGAFEFALLQGDLVVSATADIVDNNFTAGGLSLREAVLIANGRPGVDTITFAPEIVAVDGIIIGLTDGPLKGDLHITESVDIVGPGAAELIIGGRDGTRIFTFQDETNSASTFNLSGVTLVNGNGQSESLDGVGGAVMFADISANGGVDTLNVSDVVIRNSTADSGGALFAIGGNLNISDSVIALNSATGSLDNFSGGGLALQNSNATLERVGITNNTGNRLGGGFAVFSNATSAGLGTAQLTVVNSLVDDNTAERGGGLASGTSTSAANANLTVVGTTIEGNESSRTGAGIHLEAGSATVSTSLLTENSSGAAGGGIFAINASLRVENSTLSANASSGNSGGAIRLTSDRAVDPLGDGISETVIVNSTVAFNQSGSTGAITAQAGQNSTAVVTSQNSIFAENTGAPNFGVFSGSGQTTFLSAGHNLSDDSTGNLVATGDQLNTDPRLFALLDNGGPTRTHALQLDSPAINAGSNALAVDANGNPLATDQRGEGFARIVDGTPSTVDIGAFENVPFEGDLIVSNVTDVVDGLIGEGEVSLREAILIANDREGLDTITFAPGLSSTITLTNGELHVTDSIDIVGPGSNALTLDAGGESRIFFFGDVLAASQFRVSGITMINGDSQNGGGIDDHGGAVLFFDALGQGGEDSLELSDVAIRDSSAAVGGGLRSVLGTLTVTNSLFLDNEATGDIDDLSGGGLALQQTETSLENVTVTGNTARQLGGGIVNFVGVDTPTLGNANLRLLRTTISQNSASQGGGIHSETRTNLAEASVFASAITVSGNTTTGTGAGIQTKAGMLDIGFSLISDNVAGLAGGGIFAQNALLSLVNSTISGNRSNGNSGGAIRLFGQITNDPDGTGQSVTNISDSTIAFNSSGNTGAITGLAAANSSVVVNSQNSIFANNSGSPNFGVFNVGSGNTQFISQGHNLSDDGSGNLTANTDQPNTDPLLEPLSDNEGPTRTHSLRADSPAIDAGRAVSGFDQRLFSRPFDIGDIPNANGGNGDDIGALEFRPDEASSLVVNTTEDVVSRFDNVTSLREAIAFADSLEGADSVTFSQSLSGATIVLDGTELSFTNSLTIDGSALSSPLTIDANGRSRVLSSRGPSVNLTLDSLIITGGNAVGANGGALLFGTGGARGLLTVRNSIITENTAAQSGGGIFFDGTDSMTVINSIIRENTAGVDGGGIAVFSGDLSVTNTSVFGNTANRDGGGVFLSNGTVTVTESVIRQNVANDGGGIALSNSQATVLRTTVTENSASGPLGGGGMREVRGGRILLVDSTISNNSAVSVGGGVSLMHGSLFVSNSTVSGNNSDASGGAIRTGAADVEIVSSTIVDNVSTVAGGAIFNGESVDSSITIANSIVADNQVNGVPNEITRNPRVELTINHSLIGNADSLGTILGNVGNLFGTQENPLDPLLAELADNGGRTQTHALLAGSPAIDAGDNALAVDVDGNPLTFDQRGETFDRIFNGTVDIGAVESAEADTVAPAVESIVINNGDAQRSRVNVITVHFSEIVNVSATDFLLLNTDTDTNITPTLATQLIDGKTVATLTFSGSGTTAGSLDDGNYSLTIRDTITDNAGNPLDGDGNGAAGGNATDDFFRLYGDSNGDGTANIVDFFQFRSRFGSSI